jgi:hypothetical protein
MRRVILTATLAALLGSGCGDLEPGSTPDNPIQLALSERVTKFSPFGNYEGVRAVFGYVPPYGHRLVYQRITGGPCVWSAHGDGNMIHDLWINLSAVDDVGIVPGSVPTRVVCDGVEYKVEFPRFADPWSSSIIHEVGMYGDTGNDTLHCAGKGWCNGYQGNDTLIAWHSFAGNHKLTLGGGADRDKLLVFGDWPVALYGGDGPDCLAASHPNTVSAYNCANENSTSDPSWDHSVGWIGSWCNQVSTDFCSDWLIDKMEP